MADGTEEESLEYDSLRGIEAGRRLAIATPIATPPCRRVCEGGCIRGSQAAAPLKHQPRDMSPIIALGPGLHRRPAPRVIRGDVSSKGTLRERESLAGPAGARHSCAACADNGVR